MAQTGDIYEWIGHDYADEDDVGCMWLVCDRINPGYVSLRCVHVTENAGVELGHFCREYSDRELAVPECWRRVPEGELTPELKATVMLALMGVLDEPNSND